MENENYEEHSFSITELSEESHRAWNIILAIVVAAVVLTAMFLTFTATGRQWMASGSAILGKSFADAAGFRSLDNVPHEIAVGDAASDSPQMPSGMLDAEASDSMAQISFPSFLSATPPEGTSKKKTAKKADDARSAAPTPDEPPVIAMDLEDTSATDLPMTFRTGVASPSSTPLVSASLKSVPSPASRAVLPGQTYPVTIAIAGDGRGFVTSTPAGIACDGTGTCTWNFEAGQKISLRASHDAASSFAGWASGCSGISAQCTVTVNAPMRLTASFTAKIVSIPLGGVSAAPSPAAIVAPPQQQRSSPTPATSSDISASSSVEATSAPVSALPTGTVPAASGSAGHIIIATVQISSTASTNDFVTLRNPTAQSIDVSGWKLRKKSSSGTDASLRIFPAGTMMAAGGKFTWANSAGGFSDSIGADIASTQTLAADSSVALFDTSGAMVDAVAWGNGLDQYGEGSPFLDNPAAGQLLARRVGSDGSTVDTNDNAKDFVLQ